MKQWRRLELGFNRLLPKSLFSWSKTFLDKSKARSRRCQNSPLGQGHVIVKPRLLIFKLIAGYGCLFFGYAPGPDLACKASVQRGYLRNTVTTTLYSRGVAPGQACDMAPYWVDSKWFIAP
jgi:hypothetical protein